MKKIKVILTLTISILYIKNFNGQNMCLNVKDFGAVGDGIVNDFNAIQSAINSAETAGNTVCFPVGIYAIDATLTIPSGVSLSGEGTGATATSTPYNGSIIKNTGTAQTILINGNNVGIKQLAVYDTDNAGAAGGIKIEADGVQLIHVNLENVLLYGFTDGEALSLEAKNAGGLAYCSFYDLNVRHAKTGVLIEQDATSYVNSNTFYHGAISGGGFDYGVRIKGGNNNVFNELVIEPPTSNYGHLVVEKGEVIGNNIRIEANSQGSGIPIIEFKTGTFNSIINGTFAGGLVIDNGDNNIDLSTGKNIFASNQGINLFVNSAFTGVSTSEVPFWEINGTGVSIEQLDPELLDRHFVLKITVPAGVNAFLRPTALELPIKYDLARYQQVNFGIYAKTDHSNTVTTTCVSPAGLLTGGYHTGNNSWEFIGMKVETSNTTSYDPKFQFLNSSSSTDLVVYLSLPTLAFGTDRPQLESAPVTAAGGSFLGTVTYGLQEVDAPTNTFLVLPKQGNYFIVNGTSTVSRINHTTADRFPKGTVITLIFNDASLSVTNSAYIKLLTGYISTANSSLTLIANGDGTWRELGRNL